MVIVSGCVPFVLHPSSPERRPRGSCLRPAAEIIGCKPLVQFSHFSVNTLSPNELSLCFDLITQRRTKLERNKAFPDHLSFRIRIQLRVELKCFPVSAPCRSVWTLSVWRCTVKIQSLRWCALWIYTWEFITWLASFALFIAQGERDCNLNADSVVFTLTTIWQRCPC